MRFGTREERLDFEMMATGPLHALYAPHRAHAHLKQPRNFADWTPKITHAANFFALILAERARSSTYAATAAGGGKAFASALDNALTLELSE